MAKSFPLAFSTGDSIDRGAISGRIFDSRPDGIMVFGFLLTGINPDTLDPSHTRPDYVVQTSADGSFDLTHLRWGLYRVIAVRDEYKNYVYDVQTDAFGVWRRDVEISTAQPFVNGLTMRMSVEDTTKPFVSSAKPYGRGEILLRFSEAIDSSTVDTAMFSVADTLNGAVTRISSVRQNFNQMSDVWLQLASKLDSGRTYRVTSGAVKDMHGNPIDSAHANAVFTQGADPDTLRPVMASAMRDSTRDVKIDDPIVLQFSEPPARNPGSGFISMNDSSRRVVSFGMQWRGGQELRVLPKKELQENAWYQMRIQMDSISGVSGRGYKDSVVNIRFRTGDYRTTGNIEGNVSITGGKSKPVRISARNIDMSIPSKHEIRIPKPGPFEFQRLPEGHYALDAYAETDSTGLYHFGNPKPFRPSAPFGVSRDTVRVRARWNVSGVKIDIQ
jgi:hypothetical protein